MQWGAFAINQKKAEESRNARLSYLLLLQIFFSDKQSSLCFFASSLFGFHDLVHLSVILQRQHPLTHGFTSHRYLTNSLWVKLRMLSVSFEAREDLV